MHAEYDPLYRPLAPSGAPSFGGLKTYADLED